MRNASRMARYMMLNSMRQGGGNSRGEMRGQGGNMRNEMRNEGARYEMRGEMRNEGREEMRGEYGRSEMRNGYGGEMRNEGGNYARDNYGVDNRFRDRRGREHYDNGRFAPMRNELGNMGGDYSGGYSRSNSAGREYGAENRGGREGEMRRGGGRSEMRSNWDEEKGGRMNMIGFDRPQEAQSHYPTRIDYMPRNEMERGSSPKMTGGAMGMGMEFTPEIAKEWTQKLHNEDGSKGEHWSMEQVKKQMTQRGVEYNAAEVYAIMNLLYSDYCKVFKKYGFNSAEAYLDLAIAWLNDADAVENKAMMYYECIVKH